jgi:hypothetical protein
MQDSGTLLAVVERDVLAVESGLVSKTLMAVTSYLLPYPRLVLTRQTSTPNAIGATVFYTEISEATLGDWKRNWVEKGLMILKPVLPPTSGHRRS